MCSVLMRHQQERQLPALLAEKVSPSGQFSLPCTPTLLRPAGPRGVSRQDTRPWLQEQGARILPVGAVTSSRYGSMCRLTRGAPGLVRHLDLGPWASKHVLVGVLEKI